MTRQILLSPGPVTLTSRVCSALSVNNVGHREPEFAALTKDVNAELVNVYETTKQGYESVLLTGSGTCAVEAMLATFAPMSAKTLVIANGIYGERAASMLECRGAPFDILRFDWTRAIDIDAVEARIRENSGFGAVFAVQHETTTGRLNDIAALGDLCRKVRKPLFLDAVSSFGAEEIEVLRWNVAALAGSANKCLHGVPGVSFVIASRSQWAAANSSPGSLYLDLKRYRQAQTTSGYSPFTQAVQVVIAFREALLEFREGGGWPGRQRLFLNRAAKIRGVLEGVGIEPLLPFRDMSCVLQSFWLPAGIRYQSLHDDLASRGFVIYGGQGQLSGKIFRIANMGDIRSNEMERLCAALQHTFDRS